MNELIKVGKKRTILISISVLLISLHTIYFYHSVRPEIESRKLITQIVRFLLTAGLLIMVYKGKNWARIVSVILFSLALLGVIVAFGTLDTPILNKVPFMVMILIYLMAIYHFAFAKSFKEYIKHKNSEVKTKEVLQDSKELMEADKFWGIIEISKSKSFGDYEKQQSELQKELLKLNAIEILEFYNKFKSLRGEIYNWDFWAAAYIMNGGCSDDCFSDFRGWLIGQGKSIFENAVNDINALTQIRDTNDGNWEGLSYIPTDAYEKKTGNDIPKGIQENMEITGEEWNEDNDDLKNRYPELWKTFGLNYESNDK